MVSQQLSFKLGKNQVPCITFGWLIFYMFATSIVFGLMGAKMGGGTDLETGETIKRNWQGAIAAIVNTIIFILFLLGLVIGCKCNSD